jgi:hypothetical protein
VQGCQNTPLGGLLGLDCELGALLTDELCDTPLHPTLASVFIAKVGKARGFVRKAGTATRTSKRRKLLRKVDRQLRMLERKVEKSVRDGGTSPRCGDAILRAVGERRGLVSGLRS